MRQLLQYINCQGVQLKAVFERHLMASTFYRYVNPRSPLKSTAVF